jgi:acetoin utilization deacetylase AcuC-like enzyme
MHCNLAMDRGRDEGAYAAVRDVALDRAAGFGAELLVVLLGVDGHLPDPPSESSLAAAEILYFRCPLGAQGQPMLHTQESGYWDVGAARVSAGLPHRWLR